MILANVVGCARSRDISFQGGMVTCEYSINVHVHCVCMCSQEEEAHGMETVSTELLVLKAALVLSSSTGAGSLRASR